jgi:hypothetical protein
MGLPVIEKCYNYKWPLIFLKLLPVTIKTGASFILYARYSGEVFIAAQKIFISSLSAMLGYSIVLVFQFPCPLFGCFSNNLPERSCKVAAGFMSSVTAFVGYLLYGLFAFGYHIGGSFHQS